MTSLAVLIATYHRDDHILLDAALRSVLDQQLLARPAVHVYLGVDGPIGPELEAVIETLSPRIHCVVRSQFNKGLAATLNELIDRLGDESFVFRMDADDLSLPLRFQRQIDFLQNHPDVDIVGTDITEWDCTTGRRRLITFARDHDDAVRKISRRVPVAHPTVCFRRSVFDAVHQYPLVSGNEDIAMWFECLRNGLRFGNVHQPLLQFTINSEFWARRSFAKAFSEFKCYVRGIWQLQGWTWHYVYPVARLLVRVSPWWVSKFLYGTSARGR